ncbi:MAG TPA: hypothetical protein VMY42_25780 [Thermoguttaceae bacterium]|nr:hypothetical protein [Thermoguttaceae bacterium]
MALWPAKKDQDEDAVKIGVPDLPEAAGNDAKAGKNAGPNDAAELHQLTDRLRQLRQMLEGTGEQVLQYLMHRDAKAAATAPDDGRLDELSRKIDVLAGKLDRLGTAAPAPAESSGGTPLQPTPADENALKTALGPVQEKLGQIDVKLQSLSEQTAVAAGSAVMPMLGEIRDGVYQQAGALACEIRQFQQRVEAGLQQLDGLLRPEEPDPAATGPAGSADWQRVILGPHLAGRPELDFQRQHLLNGVMDGEPGACSLAGQLLVFQSATAEKMPPLLKEIGEAYYRWQPKTRPGSNPMEEALVGWLKRSCEDAGIFNTIELVHPGERFDSTRHTANARGVEITEVHGWIVLRDNGKVYTKAGVAVK